jgi:hypothetical protein
MTADDQMRAEIRVATPLQGARRRSRELVRGALWRLAPAYARRRARKAGLMAAVHRLETEFAHVSKRHSEQIERLEDLAAELVKTAESLRREIAERERRDGD